MENKKKSIKLNDLEKGLLIGLINKTLSDQSGLMEDDIETLKNIKVELQK